MDPTPTHAGAPARPARSLPAIALRLEGLLIFAGAVYFYAQSGGNWWLFLVLLLVPDLSMLGYLRNPRTGARLYNAGHTYLAPALLIVLGAAIGAPLAIAIATIWIAHIGIDRALGFGLKYPDSFKHTHFAHL